MDNRLFLQINMAQHRVFTFANTQCEALLGFSVTQAAALLHVAKNEGCLQKELSAALGLKHPATAGLAARMEKNGLIERTACKEDGRASRLFLTEQGRTKLPLIFPLIKEINQHLASGFSAEEIDVVLRFLNQVLRHDQ